MMIRLSLKATVTFCNTATAANAAVALFWLLIPGQPLLRHFVYMLENDPV